MTPAEKLETLEHVAHNIAGVITRLDLAAEELEAIECESTRLRAPAETLRYFLTNLRITIRSLRNETGGDDESQ